LISFILISYVVLYVLCERRPFWIYFGAIIAFVVAQVFRLSPVGVSICKVCLNLLVVNCMDLVSCRALTTDLTGHLSPLSWRQYQSWRCTTDGQIWQRVCFILLFSSGKSIYWFIQTRGMTQFDRTNKKIFNISHDFCPAWIRWRPATNIWMRSMYQIGTTYLLLVFYRWLFKYACTNYCDTVFGLDWFLYPWTGSNQKYSKSI